MKQDVWGTCKKWPMWLQGIESTRFAGDVEANLKAEEHRFGTLPTVQPNNNMEDIDTVVRMLKIQVPHVSVWWGPTESKNS